MDAKQRKDVSDAIAWRTRSTDGNRGGARRAPSRRSPAAPAPRGRPAAAATSGLGALLGAGEGPVPRPDGRRRRSLPNVDYDVAARPRRRRRRPPAFASRDDEASSDVAR